MNLLFLTSRLPYPPHRGDKLKIYNLIKHLSQRGHEITLLSFISTRKEKISSTALLEFCVEVKAIHLPLYQSILNCLFNIFSAAPFQIFYFKSRKMKRLIETTLSSGDFDAIHVHLIRMAQYGVDVTGIPRILDLTDAGSLYLERFLKVTKNPFFKLFLKSELKRLKQYETVLEKFDTCLVCSAVDKESLFLRAPHAKIDLLYNGIDLDYFTPDGSVAADSSRIVYTGNMSYYPNADGVVFFVNKVFPLVQQKLPHSKLFIVGQKPSRKIRSLQNTNIIVTGFVSDIREHYLRSTVAIAPIRFGAGTLNKVLEPMALGVPVVATSIAAEGLPVHDEREILIADSPEDFAGNIVRLLTNAQLRKDISENARQLVRNLYSWSSIASTLENVYVRAAREINS
ncbi:MAG: glycosyltransferase [Bacteroidota bacterium]|nr:glycosyltransferase [Bacteroidota bacterium]